MKNPRTFLWIGLALILLVNVQVWISEFGPRDAAIEQAQRQALEQQKRDNPLAAEVPTAVDGAAPAAGAPAVAPGADAGDVPVVAAPSTDAAAATPTARAAESTRVINVRTDVLDVDISLRGADLVRADLTQYPVKKGSAEAVRLLRNGGPGDQYLLQTGLAGASANAQPAEYPTHLVQFQTPFTGFRLEPGIDEMRVPFTWTSPEGVEVTKTLVFRRGSYRIDVLHDIRNGSDAPWSVAPYAQIQRDMPPQERSYFNVDSYSFTGP